PPYRLVYRSTAVLSDFMQDRPATHVADTLADSATMANEKGIDSNSNSNLILNSYVVERCAKGPNILDAVKESLEGEVDNIACTEAECVSLHQNRKTMSRGNKRAEERTKISSKEKMKMSME
ncbi:hypothetical protein U1Q18_014758, partial [Sarracenia purpurea var. burkii]